MSGKHTGLTRTQVPIVKYLDAEAGCQVDICFNQTNGPRNSSVVKAFLNDYWELRPLVLVLKYFLLQRDLNETYTGGIGSYALVLLVISFLQVTSQIISTNWFSILDHLTIAI